VRLETRFARLGRDRIAYQTLGEGPLVLVNAPGSFSHADVAGIGVHIAARVMAAAEPGEIPMSRTVHDLVAGSGIRLRDRATHRLKGVQGDWQLLAVTAPDPEGRVAAYHRAAWLHCAQVEAALPNCVEGGRHAAANRDG
jgi:hypothetical protein